MLLTEVIVALKNMGFTVDVQEVNKNGQILKGVILNANIECANPVLYPERYSTIEELLEDYENAIKTCPELYDSTMNTNILDVVRIGLARYVSSDVVKRKTKYHGMTVYLYGTVPNGTFKITRALANNYDEKQLWKAAKENTFKAHTLFEMYDGMYVVTNKEGYLGAASVMDKRIVSKLAKKLNVKRFVCLPSSIHEVILVPDKQGYPLDFYNDMVKDVNVSVVDPIEVLSDEAFILTV